MGLMMTPECFVLAIGPYAFGISDCLDYDASRYRNLPLGTTVTSCLAEVTGSKKVSCLLNAVGATLDPVTWALSPTMINYNRLLEIEDIDLEEIESLRILADAGFKLQIILDH